MEQTFLNELQANGDVSIFLSNAICLSGKIEKHDLDTIMLSKDNKPSLVYKNCITTISSNARNAVKALSLADGEVDEDMYIGTEHIVETMFLNGVKHGGIPVCVFLINGIKLKGNISNFSERSLLLGKSDTDSKTQLIYKKAIATIMADL
jgi:host factor-I protein